MTTLDQTSNYLYTVVPKDFLSLPVPQLQNQRFRASNLNQLGAWIVAQDFGAFKGWTLDESKEDNHGEFAKDWKGFIALKSPTGNRYKVGVDIRYVIQPIPKTYDEMTMDEKAEAVFLALKQNGIKL